MPTAFSVFLRLHVTNSDFIFFFAFFIVFFLVVRRSWPPLKAAL